MGTEGLLGPVRHTGGIEEGVTRNGGPASGLARALSQHRGAQPAGVRGPCAVLLQTPACCVCRSWCPGAVLPWRVVVRGTRRELGSAWGFSASCPVATLSKI